MPFAVEIILFPLEPPQGRPLHSRVHAGTLTYYLHHIHAQSQWGEESRRERTTLHGQPHPEEEKATCSAQAMRMSATGKSWALTHTNQTHHESKGKRWRCRRKGVIKWKGSKQRHASKTRAEGCRSLQGRHIIATVTNLFLALSRLWMR